MINPYYITRIYWYYMACKQDCQVKQPLWCNPLSYIYVDEYVLCAMGEGTYLKKYPRVFAGSYL